MFSVTALLRCAAVLAAVRGVASGESLHRADSGACDTGEVAAALTTLPHTQLTGPDLWNLCTSRFSKGICFVAGQTLRAELSDKDPGDISVTQFASSACSAVEAAKYGQQALLQRQEQQSAPAEMELGQSAQTARAAELAAIRSSPQAHQLSMSVAEHYRNRQDDSESGHFNSEKLLNLDDVLHRKSFSFPHNTFDWEKNHTTRPSFQMQDEVNKWMEDHALHIDVSRPDIKYRTNFYKKFSSNNANFDVVQAGDSGGVDVDVSLQENAPVLQDDGTRVMFKAKQELLKEADEQSSDSKEGAPKQAPASNVQMTALGAFQEAQTLRKPSTKNFLASHADLNNLLSEVMGKKNTVKVAN